MGCWPSWTGGNWKATRTVPSDDDSVGGGGGPPRGGKLAGIIIGAIAGLVALVAIGVFAAKLYARFVAVENLAQKSGQGRRPSGTDREVRTQLAHSEETVQRPPKVRSSLVGSAHLVRMNELRHDSVGTISNASVCEPKHAKLGRVSGSSQPDIQEVSGHQEHAHELASGGQR